MWIFTLGKTTDLRKRLHGFKKKLRRKRLRNFFSLNIEHR